VLNCVGGYVIAPLSLGKLHMKNDGWNDSAGFTVRKIPRHRRACDFKMLQQGRVLVAPFGTAMKRDVTVYCAPGVLFPRSSR
jgi:hypothetical protein